MGRVRATDGRGVGDARPVPVRTLRRGAGALQQGLAARAVRGALLLLLALGATVLGSAGACSA
jgi:hypothetical protein